MSDEDDAVYVKRTRTIHYGSLEDGERARIVSLENIEDHNTDGPTTVPQIHASTGNY